MTPKEQWQAWKNNLTSDMKARNDPTSYTRIPWFVQNPWNAQVPEEYLNQYGNDYEGIVAAQKAAWEQHTGLKYDPTAAYNNIDYLGRRMAEGVLLTPEAWETNLGFPPTEQIHFVGGTNSAEPVYQPSSAAQQQSFNWFIGPEAYYTLGSYLQDPETWDYWSQDTNGDQTYQWLTQMGFLDPSSMSQEWFMQNIWPPIFNNGVDGLLSLVNSGDVVLNWDTGDGGPGDPPPGPGDPPPGPGDPPPGPGDPPPGPGDPPPEPADPNSPESPDLTTTASVIRPGSTGFQVPFQARKGYNPTQSGGSFANKQMTDGGPVKAPGTVANQQKAQSASMQRRAAPQRKSSKPAPAPGTVSGAPPASQRSLFPRRGR